MTDKHSFLLDIARFCANNDFNWSIRYSESEAMYYDLEISSYPEGRLLYKKRVSYFDDKMQEEVLAKYG